MHGEISIKEAQKLAIAAYLKSPEFERRLAQAIADHGDICSRMAVPECAADIIRKLLKSL